MKLRVNHDGWWGFSLTMTFAYNC